MLNGDRNFFNQLKVEKQNNSKNGLNHSQFISKIPEDENKLIAQYNRNDIREKNIGEKTFNYGTSVREINNQEIKEIEIDGKKSMVVEPEVKYIVINNENINLGMRTKLPNKINKLKSLKYIKKNKRKSGVKFDIKKKNLRKKNINFIYEKIQDSDEEQNNKNIQDTNLISTLKSNQNAINTRSQSHTTIEEPPKINVNNSKNRFIIHQEAKEKRNFIFKNSKINNDYYQKNKIISTHMTIQNDFKEKNINNANENEYKVPDNKNSINEKGFSGYQNDVINFPQIFESQNPGILISGIEYTTLLIPKMCVEKFKSILFG